MILTEFIGIYLSHLSMPKPLIDCPRVRVVVTHFAIGACLGASCVSYDSRYLGPRATKSPLGVDKCLLRGREEIRRKMSLELYGIRVRRFCNI